MAIPGRAQNYNNKATPEYSSPFITLIEAIVGQLFIYQELHPRVVAIVGSFWNLDSRSFTFRMSKVA